MTKAYMEQNHIFADAFNYYIFEGQQVVLPERLRPLDIMELAVPYGADDTSVPEQRYRDVLKGLTAMRDEAVTYLILGIENQSSIHYAIPVKNFLYDALNYAKQVQKAARSHHAVKDYREHNEGEFLSGFYKNDKLVPVITLVIFFSPDEWDGPTSLHEMLNVQDKRILSFVPDYQVHLIAPSRLSDEKLKKFHSTLREVLTLIKYSNNKDEMNRVIHSDFHKLRKEELDVLNYCVNLKLELKPGEEEMDVCKAWEDMKKEVAAQAIRETEERTMLQNLQNMMEAFQLSAEQAMAILKIPEARRARLAEKLLN